MDELIDDLLKLSRVSRDDMSCGPVDLTALAHSVTSQVRELANGQALEFLIAPNLVAAGDARLLRIVLENLLGNSVKFCRGQPVARIQFGSMNRNGAPAFFVKDNGVGFDPVFAKKLFGAFQRFHTTADFPGNGIGLATVQRIIHRHGGRVTAESQVDGGATFYFTLPDQTIPTS